ncbi:Lpg1974 family pore-forming outer membrane protein [Legionella quateirensis]|uniref:Major outer membrane protein n=1 Tax=Legionella quateirensis TaxID=45072 RepID=A0A378KQE7_9GAMM|nr:Lpg1974 family pore-forming outer membrane protein [Legionella quateirensis]KTD52881.1 hypothetical protein Lqua_0714 [Legionella quateirensis]STY16389.1 Uncharacterised protein [Legionella quateirensis]
MKKQQIITCAFLSFISFFSAASGELTFFEDLLYWHASQESTSTWAYVQTIQIPEPPPPRPSNIYTEPNVYFNWSPGVKVGIQYEQPALFDTKLYWTYFSNKAREAITANTNEIILPEFFNGFTVQNVFNAAQLNWRLIMNMVDAEIGHKFNPLDTLIVRPFIGIKGGTINQSINSSWQENLFNTTLYSATEHLKNNFWGVGPSFGIDSVWHLYKNINIRSDFATAFLWGHWNIKDVYHQPQALLGFIPEKTVTSNMNNSMLGSFMTRGFLGLEWSFQAKAQVTIKAGYEMQFWSNQLRIPIFQAVPIHGDLTLQGATCGISINL